MSDLIIKGLSLPKVGRVVTLTIFHDGTIADKLGKVEELKAEKLNPHGRLIDIDRFIKEERDFYCSNCEKSICKTCWVFLMIDEIDEAPKVLEANYQQINSKQ